jgi:hypothetical protein
VGKVRVAFFRRDLLCGEEFVVSAYVYIFNTSRFGRVRGKMKFIAPLSCGVVSMLLCSALGLAQTPPGTGEKEAPGAPGANDNEPPQPVEENPCFETTGASNGKPFNIFEKDWLLVGIDASVAPWSDRAIGGVIEYVPWVSDYAVWAGLQASLLYDFRADSDLRAALTPTIGYSWFSLSSGVTYDFRTGWKSLGSRNKLSMLIPIELAPAAETFSSECCSNRWCTAELLRPKKSPIMKCTCDRSVSAIVLRPYFQLDWLQDKATQNGTKRRWHPIFGLSLSYAYGRNP